MKKVYVITGGGSGMGLATIKELGKECKVIISGRNAAKLPKFASKYLYKLKF